MFRPLVLFALLFIFSAMLQANPATKPFVWENATVYFLLIDRFNNGDPNNDLSLGRKKDGGPLRSFEGGDLKGIIDKLEAGYFDALGVDALWISPHIEQISGSTDEGTGRSYGFHGYWAQDWTAVDPNFGTYADLKTLVDRAHARGIRVLLDVAINHTGPLNPNDAPYPDDWIRTEPPCTFKDMRSTIQCTLVKGLPDIRTESNDEVALPPFLAEKWRKEGRYEKEMQELDTFFATHKLPRAPRYYLMKWHLDWVRELGVDGFRVDTVKHTEPEVWREFKSLAEGAFAEWKKANPEKVLSDDAFYFTGEVYGYGIQSREDFSFSENEKVNYFNHGFDSLINFSLKADANRDYEAIFSEYSTLLQQPQVAVLNYLSSHDDGEPFDAQRSRALEAANKLLLAPGAAQIYYGDEVARPLVHEAAQGDAKLRTPMDWASLQTAEINAVLKHWQRLGQFRSRHPAVGAGLHRRLNKSPYVFSRHYQARGIDDKVVVALDLKPNRVHRIPVTGVFADGETVRDAYSNNTYKVIKGAVTLHAVDTVLLLENMEPAAK